MVIATGVAANTSLPRQLASLLPAASCGMLVPLVDTNNELENEKSKRADDIQWHLAFCNAIRLDLEEYENDMNSSSSSIPSPRAPLRNRLFH